MPARDSRIPAAPNTPAFNYHLNCCSELSDQLNRFRGIPSVAKNSYYVAIPNVGSLESPGIMVLAFAGIALEDN